MKAASEYYVEFYKAQDQTKWADESKIIVQYLSMELKNKYLYFADLMAYLAKERHRLAVLLGHQDAANFGYFCREGFGGCYEDILKPGYQRQEVLPLVTELLKQGKETSNEGLVVQFENPFLWLFPQSDQQEKRKKAKWASDHLHKNWTSGMSARIFEDYRFGCNKARSSLYKNPEGNIVLIYRGFNKYDLIGDYFSAQALYDDLLNWDPETSVDLFMERAAKFSYFMVHGIFVRRGMASMTEWMVRGIAAHHGLELTDFYPDELGWPWRALTMTRIDDYIEWFKTRSYMVKTKASTRLQSTFFSKQESPPEEVAHSPSSDFTMN